MSGVPQAVRKRVARQAGFRCGYCLTRERVSGVPLTLEHLIPQAKGGGNTEDNLWLSCRLCNEAKGVLTEFRDPGTGVPVGLFDPRRPVYEKGIARIKVCADSVDIDNGELKRVKLSVEFCIGTEILDIPVEKCWKVISRDIPFFSLKDSSNETVRRLTNQTSSPYAYNAN